MEYKRENRYRAPSSAILKAALAIALSLSSSMSFPCRTVAVASSLLAILSEPLRPWISLIWTCNRRARITKRDVRLKMSDARWNRCSRRTKVWRVSYGSSTLLRSLTYGLRLMHGDWGAWLTFRRSCLSHSIQLWQKPRLLKESLH